MGMNRLFTRLVIPMLLLMLYVPQAVAQKKGKEKPFTVVIDPGHGGVDPGALGRKSKEKDINMNVSKLLASMIDDKYPEVKVIFTRTTDVKIPLVQRADIANKANADLFISIHSNASKSKTANGCETFTLGAGSSVEAKAAAMYENEVILSEDNFEEIYKGFDPRSSESYIIFELIRNHDMELSAEIAQMVQVGMVKESKLTNRGVSSAGFLVLHRTVMPSILVELGFITNSKDENLIASKEGQKKLAKGIFEGFSKYYEIYGQKKEKSNDKPVVKTNESKKNNTTPQKEISKDKPVFKLQIFASSSKLAPGDKRFKGEKAQYYTENGVYKYTIGESNSYEEIQQIKKNLSEKFKEAFVVAFLNGKKINTQEAVKISQKQK
ncbi:MAG: N-acetylmuramoyl-L-alanine amidase [Bacteroidaceae bacterium]|nr:N-acetylmuramoyl-L-alanine amidase [Bacteroidaceae bacterium]